MTQTCPECEGDGTIPTSDCCDAEMRGIRCMECGRRCDPSTCTTCQGEGEIETSNENHDPSDTTDWAER